MEIWKKYFSNKLVRLSQGTGDHVDGTPTMFFITKDQVPKEHLKEVTYGHITVDYWPLKVEPHKRKITVGVNLINYTGYFSTLTADTTAAKLIINSTNLTPGERYMCCDIKNYYLGTILI